MNTVTVFKGHWHADHPLPDMRIEATEPIPDLPGDSGKIGEIREWEKSHRDRYSQQGKAIVTAMLASLPGGTIDAVLLHLLEHRANIFRVPYADPDVASTLAAWLAFERSDSEKRLLLQNITANLAIGGAP